jgi:hypothetical protein
MVGMGHNEEFWNLLRMFNKDIYEMIDAFMNTRPIFKPLNSRDFMGANDNVYITPIHNKKIGKCNKQSRIVDIR